MKTSLKFLGFIALVAMCLPAHAQVVVAPNSCTPGMLCIKFTPDTASQTAVIGKARHLQYWIVTFDNGQPNPVTLSYEDVMGLAPVNLIPLSDAKNQVTAKISRSFWGNLLHYGPIVAETGGVVLLAIKGANVSSGISNKAATIVTVTGGAVQGVEAIATQNVANAATLYNQVTYPITLGPAGSLSPAYSATDHEFSSGYSKKATAHWVNLARAK